MRLFAIVLTIVCLLGIGTVTSCAEAQQPQTQVPGYYRMMVGDIEVVALSDGVNRVSVEQLLPLLKGDKEKIRESLMRAYPEGTIGFGVNAYLINTGTKLILVDAGYGKMGSAAMGNVINNLRAAGYQPERINEIYLTHMHLDHIGGLVTGTERTFPNATVYADKREAEFWLSDSNLNAAPAEAKLFFQIARTAIMPYINAGKFKTFDGSTSLQSEVRAESLFGHTPGHTAYFVESKGKTLVLWGDIIHVAAAQFEDPSVTLVYDSNNAEAAKTRQQIMAEAAKNGWLVGGAHLAFPGIGYVRTNDSSGYIFMPVNDQAAE